MIKQGGNEVNIGLPVSKHRYLLRFFGFGAEQALNKELKQLEMCFKDKQHYMMVTSKNNYAWSIVSFAKSIFTCSKMVNVAQNNEILYMPNTIIFFPLSV